MKTKTEEYPLKDWTVMVYLSGDNDLSEECVWSLKEMFRVGSSARIGLSVLIDARATRIRKFDVNALLEERARKRSAAKPRNQKSSRRIDISDRDLIAGGEDLRRGRDSMASVQTLTEFIEDVKEHHKAHRYLLILSGHASGPIGDSFLVDQYPAHALSVNGVRTAIMTAGGVDVLGMDSCGMAMAEVGYQLRECAEILVASEGFEQNTGWPYFNILTAMQADPEMDARKLAAEIVRQHTDYYSDYLMAGVSTDISACDLRKSKAVADAVRRLAEILDSSFPPDKTPPPDQQHKQHPKDTRSFVEDLPLRSRAVADAIILAHWRAQSYRFEQHVDLYDFCDLLESGCRDQAVIDACAQLKNKIAGHITKDGASDGYIIKACRSGDAFQHSHGVAIYFPWADIDLGYDDLSFATDTTWAGFLRKYAQKTRRRPRSGCGPVHWLPKSADGESRIRDVPSVGIRDVPSVGIRDVPSVGIRDVPSVGIRDVPSVGIRGKILMPQVKNQPDAFYEDKCQDHPDGDD